MPPTVVVPPAIVPTNPPRHLASPLPPVSPSSINPAMASYLAQLRRAGRANVNSRLSANNLPGAYPPGHPVDDSEWETVTDTAEMNSAYGGPAYQGAPVQNPVYPPNQPTHHAQGSMQGGPAYQGVPVQNGPAVYPPYQPTHNTQESYSQAGMGYREYM
jgi:hypothetical protein